MASNLELIRKQREALEKQTAAASKKRRKAAVEINSAEASRPIICDIEFFNVEQLVEMTGWSRKTILNMFNNDPDFKGRNNGKSWIIEAHALIEYFSKGTPIEEEAI